MIKLGLEAWIVEKIKLLRHNPSLKELEELARLLKKSKPPQPQEDTAESVENVVRYYNELHKAYSKVLDTALIAEPHPLEDAIYKILKRNA